MFNEVEALNCKTRRDTPDDEETYENRNRLGIPIQISDTTMQGKTDNGRRADSFPAAVV